MPRKKLSQLQEVRAQEPIADAFEAYFKTAYEPGSTVHSVFAGYDVDGDNVMVFSAIMAPREHRAELKAFMQKLSSDIGGIVLIEDDKETQH